MTDNFAFTPGVGGLGASDEIAGVHYARVKIVWGADGVVNDADIASGKPLPIQIRDADGNAVDFSGQFALGAGDVDSITQRCVNAPGDTGGMDVFRNLDLGSTAQSIKAAAGMLYKLRMTNRTTTPIYVKIYNIASGSVNPASSTPIDTIVIPSNASDYTVLTENFGGFGVEFSTAISIRAVTGLGDTDTTSPSSNGCVVTAYYK